MRRVFHVLAWLAILGTLGLLVSAGYLYLFDGNPPATYVLPFRTEKSVYRPEETLTLLVHTCKNRQYPLTTYPSLVGIPDRPTNPPSDGKLYPLPAVHTVGTATGCRDGVVTGLFTVPTDVPAGRYYLKGVSAYQVNFLATRGVDWYTNEFLVGTGATL